MFSDHTRDESSMSVNRVGCGNGMVDYLKIQRHKVGETDCKEMINTGECRKLICSLMTMSSSDSLVSHQWNAQYGRLSRNSLIFISLGPIINRCSLKEIP